MNINVSENVAASDAIGFALQFDGSQNYLSLGTMGSFGSSISAGLYLSFDLNTSSSALSALLGFLNTGTTTALQIELNSNGGSLSNNSVRCFLRDSSAGVLEGAFTFAFHDGNKHSFVIQFNIGGNIITVTVDGVSQTVSYASQSSTGNFSNLGFAMSVGCRNVRGTQGEFFAGTIDNLQLGTSSTTLFGNYKFDEGSGTTTADSSGNNNTGTLTGSPVPRWNGGLSPANAKLLDILTISVNDSTTTSENISRMEIDTISINDSTTITENISFSLIHTIFVSDSTITTENIILAEPFFITTSDATTVSENNNITFLDSVFTIDNSSISELIVTFLDENIIVNTSITTTESIGVNSLLMISIGDAITITESIQIIDFANVTSIAVFDTTIATDNIPQILSHFLIHRPKPPGEADSFFSAPTFARIKY